MSPSDLAILMLHVNARSVDGAIAGAAWPCLASTRLCTVLVTLSVVCPAARARGAARHRCLYMVKLFRAKMNGTIGQRTLNSVCDSSAEAAEVLRKESFRP